MVVAGKQKQSNLEGILEVKSKISMFIIISNIDVGTVAPMKADVLS